MGTFFCSGARGHSRSAHFCFSATCNFWWGEGPDLPKLRENLLNIKLVGCAHLYRAKRASLGGPDTPFLTHQKLTSEGRKAKLLRAEQRVKNPTAQKYTTIESRRKYKPVSDDFGLRSPVIQKTLSPKKGIP